MGKPSLPTPGVQSFEVRDPVLRIIGRYFSSDLRVSGHPVENISHLVRRRYLVRQRPLRRTRV